ncbi:MAG: DUF262 domain-containing protein [Candidatus Accumulibacter sp.]|jgi:hypothetical protein|nr:DUF262 domain-containing protein [Accumulibacter sp.]
MARTLEAHDKLIREIFEGSYQFEIPDYQRPYAWTTEQAGSQYFLGSIVLIENDRDRFVHIRTIYAKQKQRATLVKEFQEHVAEYKKPIDLVDKVIKPCAEVWDFVRDADFEATERAETINERLSWLNRVDFKDWAPPALVYFKRFRQQPKRLAEFFQSLERLTCFLLVMRARINERIEIYANLTKEIEPDTFGGDVAALKTLDFTDRQKREFAAALKQHWHPEVVSNEKAPEAAADRG